MTEILLNQSSNDLLVKEENQLNWNKVLEKLKTDEKVSITKNKARHICYY